MSEELRERYFTAVKSGDVAQAKQTIDELLANGVDLNKLPPKKQRTYLTYAIRYKQPDLVKYLLEKGANVNGPDIVYTPLFFATIQLEKDIVQLLLEYGADPNQGSRINYILLKPIHMAIAKDQLEILQLLVEGGADLNDNTFQLPLSLAMEEKKPAMVDFLLEAGADVNAEGTKPPASVKTQFPPLIAAIHFQDIVSLQKLINAGADVNIAFDGWSALQYAVQSGISEMVKTLCENGANVNYKYPGKLFTPLILAVIQKPVSLPILRILCDYGADKHAKTYQNQTAFTYAQGLEDEDEMNDVLRILKTCGITDPKEVLYNDEANEVANEPGKINKNTGDFDLQFLKAIETGNLKQVKQLLAYGANLSENDYEPLILAAKTGNLDLFKYLFTVSHLFLDKSHSRTDLLERFLIAAGNNLELFKYIEKKGGKNIKKVILNVLKYHIQKINNTIVSYILINYIPDIHRLDQLHFIDVAYRAGNKEAVQKLLTYLNFEKLSSWEYNELNKLVLLFGSMGNLPLLKVLKERGFDFTDVADPLWNRVYGRWIDIEKFLEASGFPKPASLTSKLNTNNTPYGGKRRTRKSRITRRKSSSRSRKY